MNRRMLTGKCVACGDEQWAEATRRLRAAGAAVRARFPTVCPACGSPKVVPTFMAEDEWECGELDCLAVWRQP